MKKSKHSTAGERRALILLSEFWPELGVRSRRTVCSGPFLYWEVPAGILGDIRWVLNFGALKETFNQAPELVQVFSGNKSRCFLTIRVPPERWTPTNYKKVAEKVAQTEKRFADAIAQFRESQKLSNSSQRAPLRPPPDQH